MVEKDINSAQAEVLQPSKNINEDVDFFSNIGFKLDTIYPADNPAVASLSGYGINIKLDKNTSCPATTINILTDNPDEIVAGKEEIVAPNGTVIRLLSKSRQLVTPPTQHKFEVRRLQDNEPWVIGRAGMLYRDLIPGRLGGSIIASHINIPKGGPVPDMVHYHTIGFQLIFCYKGWVKVVYEDQGAPITLSAGDCVTQPPEIRHRVLESSDNLEVIEIGVPAEHMTTIDHDLELPNENYDPGREFQGQRFCHHQRKDGNWQSGALPDFEYRDTGIDVATNGVASVLVTRPKSNQSEPLNVIHNADILFYFVMEGKMNLENNGGTAQQLKNGDAFVIPPDMPYCISNCTGDLELLQVSLPGRIKITSN
jgi:quercetin dioxygenase-like cupin family protein